MKKIISIIFIAITIKTTAQVKVINQAIINTKTTIISPEGDDAAPPPPPSGDGEQRVTIRLGADGETKSITTVKGDMVKTFTENETGRTTIIRDNKLSKTTTLLEMMGKKSGFYVTDAEQEQMKKKMDSLMQNRRQQENNNNENKTFTAPKIEIVYVDEQKKIASILCKKALIISTKQNGKIDSSFAWYNPNLKIQGVAFTGGVTGFGGMMRNNTATNFEKIDGFVMQYEVKMNKGRKMIVEVTKIVTDKDIADKEFEISKDYELKPMKDMQSPDGRGFQIRINNGQMH